MPQLRSNEPILGLNTVKVKEGLQECDHIHQVYYRATDQIWMMKLMRAFG